MPQKQEKTPWNQQYDRKDKAKKSAAKPAPTKKKRRGRASTVYLSFLLVLVFMILGGMIVFTLWNNRYPNMTSIANQFYPKATSHVAVANDSSSSSDAASSGNASSSASSSTDSSVAGKTYTVVAGDFPSTISSKTGVDWATIVQLTNASHKKTGGKLLSTSSTQQGYYQDGSTIAVGDVLVIKK